MCAKRCENRSKTKHNIKGGGKLQQAPRNYKHPECERGENIGHNHIAIAPCVRSGTRIKTKLQHGNTWEHMHVERKHACVFANEKSKHVDGKPRSCRKKTCGTFGHRGRKYVRVVREKRKHVESFLDEGENTWKALFMWKENMRNLCSSRKETCVRVCPWDKEETCKAFLMRKKTHGKACSCEKKTGGTVVHHGVRACKWEKETCGKLSWWRNEARGEIGLYPWGKQTWGKLYSWENETCGKLWSSRTEASLGHHKRKHVLLFVFIHEKRETYGELCSWWNETRGNPCSPRKETCRKLCWREWNMTSWKLCSWGNEAKLWWYKHESKPAESNHIGVASASWKCCRPLQPLLFGLFSPCSSASHVSINHIAVALASWMCCTPLTFSTWTASCSSTIPSPLPASSSPCSSASPTSASLSSASCDSSFLGWDTEPSFTSSHISVSVTLFEYCGMFRDAMNANGSPIARTTMFMTQFTLYDDTSSIAPDITPATTNHIQNKWKTVNPGHINVQEQRDSKTNAKESPGHKYVQRYVINAYGTVHSLWKLSKIWRQL